MDLSITYSDNAAIWKKLIRFLRKVIQKINKDYDQLLPSTGDKLSHLKPYGYCHYGGDRHDLQLSRQI